MKVLASIATAAVIVALTAWSLHERESPRNQLAQAPNSGSANAVALGPAAARAAALAPPPPTAGKAPPLSAPMQELLQSRELEPLFDRLRASARSPEENWILANILERCAIVTDRPGQAATARDATPREARLQRFAASLSPRDPAREKRIAAFERSYLDRCAGVRDVKTTQAQIKSLLDAAAAAGDPKARIDVLRRDRADEAKRRTAGTGGSFDWLDEPTVDSIKDIMASRDPEAMRTAGSMLMLQGPHSSMRAGPEETPLDMLAFGAALELAACDLGRPCGPDSDRVLSSCVYRGACEAHDVREDIFYYSSSPYQAQLIAEYYAGLNRAIYDRDWGYFHLYDGPTPSAAMWPDPPTKPAPAKADPAPKP